VVKRRGGGKSDDEDGDGNWALLRFMQPHHCFPFYSIPTLEGLP
jgi:hypothetical protein